MKRLLLAFIVLPSLAYAQAINTPPTITSFTQLQGSTGTAITGFGNAVGQAAALTNYAGTGQPGLVLQTNAQIIASAGHGGAALIIGRSGAALGDTYDVQVNRSATFAGGTNANRNYAFLSLVTQGATTGSSEHAILSQCNTSSTVAGAICDATFSQATRAAASTAIIWGTISDAVDNTNLSSLASGAQSTLGIENDIEANGADDAPNAVVVGSKGNRVGMNVVALRHTVANTAQTQFAYGIWLTTGVPGFTPPPDTHTNYNSGFGFGLNTQAYSGFDARGVIAPTASSNPVFAVNMDAGQAIEFKGDDTTLSPAPQRTLLYTASTLAYQVSAVTKFSISDTGGVTAVGLPTSAGGGGLNVCVDSVGVLYKKASCP